MAIEVAILTFLSFWMIMYVLSKLPGFKGSLKVIPPFLLIYRTEHLNEFIDSMAKKLKILWRILLNFGIIIAPLLMFGGSSLLVTNLVNLLTRPEKAYAIVPMVPGLTVSLESLPYVMMALPLIFIIHEVSHGIALRLEGIRVKSTGIMVLLLFPGAFTEGDTEQLSKSRVTSKLRVYSAGTLANFLTYLLVLFIFMNIRLPYHLHRLLSWIGLLSLFVSVFNMIPLYPLDGALYLMSIGERLKPGLDRFIKFVGTFLMIGLLSANILLTFSKFGLVVL